MKKTIPIVTCALVGVFSASAAHATFHFMQIEQVIGSVDGDSTAQAIQLRMRAAGQNIVGQTRVIAFDSAGANPIVIADIPANVANSGAGVRVLLTTASFDALTSPAAASDFAITTPIPASYFNGGKIVFDNDSGTIRAWSLAWGGAAYTGANTGATFNDADGNFNPPFASALPASGFSAIRYPGAANGVSTNNAADYMLTGDTTTWTNNAGASFTLAPPAPACPGDVAGPAGGPDGQIDVDDLNALLSVFNTSVGVGSPLDLANNDGVVDIDDLNVVLSNWQAACP